MAQITHEQVQELLAALRQGLDLPAACQKQRIPVRQVMEFLELGKQEVLARLQDPGIAAYQMAHDFFVAVCVVDALRATRFRTVPVPLDIVACSWQRLTEIARGEVETDYERFLHAACLRAEAGLSLSDVAATLGVAENYAGLAEIVAIGTAGCRARIAASLAEQAVNGDVKAAVAWLNSTDERFMKQQKPDDDFGSGRRPLTSIPSRQLKMLAKMQ